MNIQIKKALLISWIAISALLLPTIAVPAFLPARVILSGAALVSADHAGNGCSMCGMTRAFIAITQGKLEQALQLNRRSIWLYAAIAANETFVLAYLIVSRRRKYENA